MSVLNKIPTWFKVTVIVLLIWNLMGVLNFVMQLNMTEADILTLPENQQIFYAEFTILSKIAFAMGVFGGTLGCIALLAKKKIAMKLFWISFIGIVLQMNHNLGLADGGEMQNYILGMSGLLIALTLLSIYLTKKAISNNWIE